MTAMRKVDKRYRGTRTLLIGMVAEGSGPELQEDFEKILQSAR